MSEPRLTCKECADFILAYVDGELPAEQAKRFDMHMAMCPPCVDYLKTYAETIRMGKKACEPPAACNKPPEDLIKAIMAAIRPNKNG